MLDTELRPSGEADTPRLASGRALSIVLTLVMLALGLIVAAAYVGMPLDDPSLVESTPGQLALWLAARNNLDEAATLGTARIALALVALFVAPGRVSRTLGVFVVISALLCFWEVYIALGQATGNTLPLTDFPWKMPHWQNIAEQLLQPARRNGPLLLVGILAEAAFFTWREAFVGFVAGSLLGFVLGMLFAHSKLLERALLPYAIASQTVPILAIAPMIVSALGAGWLPVAVISAYLTFFPVTINTLRGLLSPDPMALELMRSYAAPAWAVLWKLRVPAALPYIFTALKVSATGSVVGAIVGELPSSRSDGLAAAILRHSGNYASQPEKLWATIVIAALVGILFFSAVSLVERWVMRRRVSVES